MAFRKQNRHIYGAFALDRFVDSGAKVAAVRRAVGVSQRSLALWLRMSQANLSRIERGSRSLRVEELMRAAAFLKVDPMELLPNEEEAPK